MQASSFCFEMNSQITNQLSIFRYWIEHYLIVTILITIQSKIIMLISVIKFNFINKASDVCLIQLLPMWLIWILIEIENCADMDWIIRPKRLLNVHKHEGLPLLHRSFLNIGRITSLNPFSVKWLFVLLSQLQLKFCVYVLGIKILAKFIPILYTT